MKTFPQLEDLRGDTQKALKDLLSTMNHIRKTNRCTTKVHHDAKKCLERVQNNGPTSL